jgi:hypothetical protein
MYIENQGRYNRRAPEGRHVLSFQYRREIKFFIHVMMRAFFHLTKMMCEETCRPSGAGKAYKSSSIDIGPLGDKTPDPPETLEHTFH